MSCLPRSTACRSKHHIGRHIDRSTADIGANTHPAMYRMVLESGTPVLNQEIHGIVPYEPEQAA